MLLDREAIAAWTGADVISTRDLVVEGRLDKGDALEVARIAGIMAAKKTSELIPLCHPIALGAVDVSLAPVEEGIEIEAVVRTTERTGVEMEALTAVARRGLDDLRHGQGDRARRRDHRVRPPEEERRTLRGRGCVPQPTSRWLVVRRPWVA